MPQILAANPRILWAHGGADRSLVRRQFRRHNRLFGVDVGKGGIHLRAIELPLPDARVTKPAPVTPLAPFEVSIATSRMVSSWPQLRSTCSACAMKGRQRGSKLMRQ